MVSVPIALLRDPDLTAAMKVLWMARRLDPSAGPADLERLTGLSRHTVLTGLGLARRPYGGPRVKVPVALLAERTVGALAKLVYGLLQTIPTFRGQGGVFTNTTLGALTGFSRSSVRRAVGELVNAGWLQVTQESRVRPIRFTLGSPAEMQRQSEIELVQRRLRRDGYKGEALMQEYLSLLIESDQFTDNARPGFLVNPLTKARLELDRFYPPGLAFEYNGNQHYRATGRFSQADVEAQRLRDLIKAGLCLYQGIQLVIIDAEDLSLEGVRNKIPACIPLRSLAGKEHLIDHLETASLSYRLAEKAGRG